MIRDSQANHPDHQPHEALQALAKKYTAVFKEDMDKVNVSSFTYLVATDHIQQMQQLIVELLDEDIAYIEDDGVYFSIDAYEKAGKTYGQLWNVVRSEAKSRIHDDEYEGAGDFALWKLKKDGEPSWEFTYNCLLYTSPSPRDS